MISVSKLLYNLDAEGDGLRYGDADSTAEQIRERKQERPVVVWNGTKRCNLSCSHCYAGADVGAAPGELTTAEAKGMLDELADYGAPVVLFSGGEPLVREDLPELVAHASDAGIRPVLSTNGTLLTRDRARELRDAGLAYAGISVDGRREVNDAFRGQEGAFDAAVDGIEACLDVGLKTGLRYTVTDDTVPDMEAVVDLLTDVGVDRFCFYHLAYGGRGVPDADITPETRRDAVERLVDLTRQYHEDGEEIETLLVGNYCDAAYLVEYARREFGPERAERVRRYLEVNGGDPAGERVADIDYQGNVHATQFWQSYSLGNVRDRPFGDIWEDESNPLIDRLRDRPDSLGEECRSCAYSDICRGASRLRALTVDGEFGARDPQCYLTPDERAGDGAFGVGSPPSQAD
ncbi:TIGR04347 family pseudo-SAM/SPASM protein [Halobaculum halobium]|uniref:TIGR04347 family pseudo-SAM/SPASM protein n=1 Tax=Halobaculum halobium TaxID=3032281 RepID=A0ABD5T6E9_9EURY|nr:TIGR04347 family pseudo-SAM/SPASM protein [Halobaculum sp. SYNS20]